MSPEQTIKNLRAWYESHDIRHKDLAASLSLSPQQLAELFAFRNRPTGIQICRIQEFLNERTMNSIRVDPPNFPKPSTRDPSVPLTLSSAKEMLAARDAELAALRAAIASPAKPGATAPTPGAKSKLAGSAADASSITTPGGNQPNKNQMAVTVPAIVKKALPPEAITPFLISEILKVTSFSDLQSMLSNPIHSALQRSLIYQAIKERRDLEANRFYK
jgi:hypothetical protein